MKKWIGFCILIASSLGLSAGETEIIYDYVIVGNGTAGAVLARKLSDSGKKKVLVLEAGVNNDSDPAVLTVQPLFPFLEALTEITFNPKYAATYGVATGIIQGQVYSEGRGWGGSSAHNYTEAVRGTPTIYNNWATLSGNPMWSYNNLLQIMKALENFTPNATTPFDPAQRGSGGPISLTQFPEVTNADPLAAALASGLNAGFVADYNNPDDISTIGTPYVGFSAFQMFATPAPLPDVVGYRSFSSNSFLDPVVTPEGRGLKKRLLRIESNAFVSRVLFNGKKAIGVEFFYADSPDKVKQAFGKQIILCAGAVHSPAILQRSGIGDAALLNSLGIDVLVDNPNVGANLNNQYGPNAIVKLNTFAAPFLHGFANASGTPALAAPFAYPNDSTRRIQVVGLNIGANLARVLFFLLNPNSRGSIKIVSKSPFIPPNIDLNMYSDGDVLTNGTDANLAVTSYYLLQNAVGAGNVVFPADYSSPQALLAQAQTLDGMTVESHISSTTQMGTSPSNAVVDGNLRVFGVKNLMVCDLGVAPELPDGNTCYCVYLLALGLANILGAPVPPAL